MVCLKSPFDVVLKNRTTLRAGTDSGILDGERWFMIKYEPSFPEPARLGLEQRLVTWHFLGVVSAVYARVITLFPTAMRSMSIASPAWVTALMNYIAIDEFRDLAKKLLLRLLLLLLWRYKSIIQQRCHLITPGHRRVDCENITRLLKGLAQRLVQRLLKRLLGESERVLYLCLRRAGGRRADNLGYYHLLSSEADGVVKVNRACIWARKV